MKRCKKCVMPDTKPHIKFEKGVCSACVAHEKKHNIDWSLREEQFKKIIVGIRTRKSYYNYDCIVPVSGGKDSIYQVHRLKEYGVKPLAISVEIGMKTDIGRKNLDVISNMCDLVVFKPEQNLHKKIMKECFFKFGDPDAMNHALLYAYPILIAEEKGLDLFFGENPAFEYSGEKEDSTLQQWMIDKYIVKDEILEWILKKFDRFPKQMMNYNPKYAISKRINVYFLSYYFFWDSEKHLEIAKKYGFKTLKRARSGTFKNYVGIDEGINIIRQYFKLLKYGYGRGTDHACEEIRNNRITRKEAMKLVKKYDRKLPPKTLVKKFCEYINITEEDFNKTMWKFTINGE